MKAIQLVLTLLVGFIIGALAMYMDIQRKTIKLELPIDGKYIVRETPIAGYYSDENTFHIDYDYDRIAELENRKGNVKIEWEGLDKDIPADGIVTLKLVTNGNTVYLNPIDE
jgi:hypothetical protein